MFRLIMQAFVFENQIEGAENIISNLLSKALSSMQWSNEQQEPIGSTHLFPGSKFKIFQEHLNHEFVVQIAQWFSVMQLLMNAILLYLQCGPKF